LAKSESAISVSLRASRRRLVAIQAADLVKNLRENWKKLTVREPFWDLWEVAKIGDMECESKMLIME